MICALGGNDRTNGGGGDDVLDAGAGADVVAGDVGNDRIDGGDGTDVLHGQGGADVIRGGAGSDLMQGAPRDGVWRASFLVPGGTPDGAYFIQAALKDSSHFESWVSPDSGWTSDSHLLTPDLAPSGTHFVVANS